MKTVLTNADFVIEGYVDPTEPWRDEGRFGDHTGPREVRILKCEVRTFQPAGFIRGFHSAFRIRHSLRPATILGFPPMEDFTSAASRGCGMKFFLPIFKMNFPEIVDLALPAGARLRFFERESDDGFWWFSYWRWWGA